MAGWAPGAFFLIALTLLDIIRWHGFSYRLFIHTRDFTLSSLDLSSERQTLTTNYPLDLATSMSSGFPNLTCPKLHFPSFLQSYSSQWTAILLFCFPEQNTLVTPDSSFTFYTQFRTKSCSLYTQGIQNSTTSHFLQHCCPSPSSLPFFLFSAPSHSMQALNSLTRDQTQAPCSGSTES